MTDQILFNVVFITQIFLLSVYFPSRVVKRCQYVLKHYPASSHPKLYPKSSQFFARSMHYYKWINGFNFVLGWVIFYFINTDILQNENGINPLLPWAYFMLQMIPSQMLEFYGLRLAKLMKQQDTRSTKTAELRPRHLTDYISPSLLGLVILSYVAFAWFAFYLTDFEFSFNGKAFLMCAILFSGYVFFYLIMKKLILGKNRDPYQTSEDRKKSISLTIKTFCFTMMACSAFMALILAADVFELKYIMPIMMSLFLQFLVIISLGYMLNKSRVEDINFDVYKNNGLSNQ